MQAVVQTKLNAAEHKVSDSDRKLFFRRSNGVIGKSIDSSEAILETCRNFDLEKKIWHRDFFAQKIVADSQLSQVILRVLLSNNVAL